jgi:hypothetical protein
VRKHRSPWTYIHASEAVPAMIPHNLVRDLIDAGFSSESVTRVTGILLNVCEGAGQPKRWQVFRAAGYVSVDWERGGRFLQVTVGSASDSNPVAKCFDVPAFPCGDGVDPAESMALMGRWLAAGDSDAEYDAKFQPRSHVNAQAG